MNPDIDIDGIGSFYGGEYSRVSIDGIGKLKSRLKCRELSVSGIFKSKADVDADSFTCDGISRIFKNIRAKNVYINGMVKLRRAKLEADNIKCDGIISCNREVNANRIDINFDRFTSIKNMYGDVIVIHKAPGSSGINFGNKCNMPGNLAWLYLGLKVRSGFILSDTIECTGLEAEFLKAKIIRARDVTLSNNCVIDRLEYSGVLKTDKSCVIKKSIKI